jgi:hypothetical protein
MDTTNKHTDDGLDDVIAELAKLTGKTIAEIEAMSMQDMRDHISRTALKTLALHAVNTHREHLANYGPDEQVEQATAALLRFHNRVPLFPQYGETVNLFGFGEAELRFVAYDPETNLTGKAYLLLSDVAEALGVPLPRANDWARQDHLDAIRTQREIDEERGDGRLGWECLDDLVDLELNLIIDDPEASPDHDGRRWSCAGDWLISDDRLLAFMTISPWNKEFLDNAGPLFGHAFRATMGDRLKKVPTYTADGQPTGTTAYDTLADTGGLTVEEARERAMRGPSGPLTDD